jgi:toxin HigB-1
MFEIVIRSFADKKTEKLWNRDAVSSIDPRVRRAALRKLVMLDAATNINDLRSPPGNRLEAMSGDRSGQHSIRINDQWRICFVWSSGGADDVEIVDYH